MGINAVVKPVKPSRGDMAEPSFMYFGFPLEFTPWGRE